MKYNYSITLNVFAGRGEIGSDLYMDEFGQEARAPSECGAPPCIGSPPSSPDGHSC